MAPRQRWQDDLDRWENVFFNMDMSPIFTELDPVVSAGFDENFANKVDEFGVPWPPHAPATVRRYGPHPLLVLSGRMKRAAITPGDSEHLLGVARSTAAYGVSGSVFYARFHHTGTSRMPRRRVIFASAATVQKMFSLFRARVIARMPKI